MNTNPSGVPDDISEKYGIHDHHNALAILNAAYPNELAEIYEALRLFCFTDEEVRKSGGNESDFPKRLSRILTGKYGWVERRLTGHFIYMLTNTNGESTVGEDRLRHIPDSHYVDYHKSRIAIDFEWNSKDQTFDRDLFAFRNFYEAGAIDVAVIITRAAELQQYFKDLGDALDEKGNKIPLKGKKKGYKQVASKFGRSTTHMGKLERRIDAHRGGGCPLLAFGIGLKCRVDNLPASLAKLEREVKLPAKGRGKNKLTPREVVRLTADDPFFRGRAEKWYVSVAVKDFEVRVFGPFDSEEAAADWYESKGPDGGWYWFWEQDTANAATPAQIEEMMFDEEDNNNE